MSKNLMAILIVLGVCVGTFVIVFGIGALWFVTNKDQFVADMQSMAKEAAAEAERYAESHDQNACVDEALRRAGACDAFGFTCEVQATLFGQFCLRDATEVPGFCDAVPEPTAILGTYRWASERCEQRTEVKPERCQRVLKGVQSYCHGDRAAE